MVTPLDEVVTLEAVGSDAAKTTGALALVVVGIAAVVFVVGAISYSSQGLNTLEGLGE